MTRTTYTATLTTLAGTVLATATAYAHNSAVRASERLVRDHARQVGQPYQGGRPERVGITYRRRWYGDSNGERLVAFVQPQPQEA